MASELTPPIYVDEAAGLDRLMRHLVRQSEIAIDCEANSLFAYRERLCLVQVSTRARDYLVDPLGDLDLMRLAPVLADPGIVKVCHGAEYDVLLLKRTRPFEVAGLFDTKVAAMSLGFPAPGLAAVLERYLGVRLDKRYQRSDWGKRPLSDGQLDYARRDTRDLLELADLLRAELHASGPPHMEECAAECRRIEALIPEARVFDPDEFERIRGANQLDPHARQALRELNRERNEIAEERDQPPFKILTNEMLVALARSRPLTPAQLDEVGVLTDKLVARFGGRMLAAMRRAQESGPLRSGRSVASDDDMDSRQRVVFDALRRWRKAEAERRRTDASLILPKATMMDLSSVRSVPDTVNDLERLGLLEGWRIRHYGPSIVRAMADANVRAGERPHRSRRPAHP